MRTEDNRERTANAMSDTEKERAKEITQDNKAEYLGMRLSLLDKGFQVFSNALECLKVVAQATKAEDEKEAIREAEVFLKQALEFIEQQNGQDLSEADLSDINENIQELLAQLRWVSYEIKKDQFALGIFVFGKAETEDLEDIYDANLLNYLSNNFEAMKATIKEKLERQTQILDWFLKKERSPQETKEFFGSLPTA